MLKHCIVRLGIVLWCLVFAFSQLGCASRYSIEALRALNQGAAIVQVCTRTPKEHPRATVWAHNLQLQETVSDRDDVFEEFAKTAEVIFHFDSSALRETDCNV